MDAQKGLTRAPDLSGKGDLYSGLHILDEYVQDTYGDEIIDEDGGKHSTDSATANLAAFREQHEAQYPDSPFNSMGPVIREVDETTGKSVEKTLVLSGLVGMDAEMHNLIAQNWGMKMRFCLKSGQKII